MPILGWKSSIFWEYFIIITFHMGCSQKRCTKGGDRVRGCITHLLSIKNSNVDGFHVSVVINISYLKTLLRICHV